MAAFGSDGARYVVLREVPFDRDAEVSWDSFVRRYNADLANDFGNLVNRTVSMTGRYLDGVRPAPRLERDSPLAEGWNDTIRLYADALEALPTPRRTGRALGVRRWRQPGRRRASSRGTLAKAWKAGDEAAGDRLRGVLGDLVETCRLVGLAVAPFMPATAPRVLAQLGFGYGYGPDGNGESSILGELEWGARASEAGRVAAPEPLFPRLEAESARGWTARRPARRTEA